MIKKKIPFFAAIGSISLLLILTLSVGASPSYALLDSVNIGNTASEADHNLDGWSNIWSGCGWCYADGNMRLIWGDGGETCDIGNNWASITLDASIGIGKTLSVSHLDGAADDGFNVYINGILVDTYEDVYPANTWTSTDFDISSWNFTDLLTIKFEATASAWGGCPTYGQVAFDLIELWGSIHATIDIDPDTLNLKSKGKFITAYIELPEGFDVNSIDVSTIMLNEIVPAEISPTEIGDYDSDGVMDLMVKFDRAAVQATLEAGESVEITITGSIDGMDFEGSDFIRVIDKGKEHTSEDASSIIE